ncbi:TonB-dependent receptor domain-containing protein, partial [candidate division CSSED10-310 bacterium]
MFPRNMVTSQYACGLLSKVLLLSSFLIPVAVEAAQDSIVNGTVTDLNDSQVLPGAGIFVVGTEISTYTDLTGRYRLKLPPGTYQLRAHLSGYLLLSKPVVVTTGQSVRVDFKLQESLLQVDEVVIVGSRRTDRTVVDSTVPIDVFTAADIEQTGLTETSQIIQMLAPSFNFPRPSITDGTDHVRPSSLRGLGPDQLLVLVNGIRRHTSALVNVNSSMGRGSTGVDLNTIPVNMIERIEILRDGAAAQYGTDAIAGVINIVLRTDRVSELSVTAGQTSEGDGENFRLAGNHCFSLGSVGFLHLGGEYRDRGFTNRAGEDPRPQYFALPDGEPDPREESFERQNHRLGDADTLDYSFFLNSSIPVTDTVEIYAFGGLTFREGESSGFYRRSLDDRNVRSLYPDGFLPFIISNIFDTSFAIGCKGYVFGWLGDLTAVYGVNSFQFKVEDSLNTSMGTASPTEFDCGTLQFNQLVTNLDLLRTLDVGLASPASLGLGLEFRRENYQIMAGEEASYIDGGVPLLDGPNEGNPAPIGAQVFPGFQPSDEVDETRTNFGFYLDLEFNPFADLLCGMAARFENYSDFGDTTDGKVSLRYEPVTGYALRGAASSGYRAPSLAQSYYSATATAFLNVDGEYQP